MKRPSRPVPTHRYIPEVGEAADHKGRVPCHVCSVMDHPQRPVNRVHRHDPLDGDRSAAVLGEGEAA